MPHPKEYHELSWVYSSACGKWKGLWACFRRATLSPSTPLHLDDSLGGKRIGVIRIREELALKYCKILWYPNDFGKMLHVSFVKPKKPWATWMGPESMTARYDTVCSPVMIVGFYARRSMYRRVVLPRGVGEPNTTQVKHSICHLNCFGVSASQHHTIAQSFPYK